MSVPKSRRGESPAQYIDLAREIYVFTYNRVRLLPKAYTLSAGRKKSSGSASRLSGGFVPNTG